jgi:hypothetical protein
MLFSVTDSVSCSSSVHLSAALKSCTFLFVADNENKFFVVKPQKKRICRVPSPTLEENIKAN